MKKFIISSLILLGIIGLGLTVYSAGIDWTEDFESYSNGAITGQGYWTTSSGTANVVSDVYHLGNKSLRIYDNSDVNFSPGPISTTTESVSSLTFYFRKDDITGGVTQRTDLFLENESGYNFGRVQLYDGDVRGYNDLNVVFGNYESGSWYRVDLLTLPSNEFCIFFDGALDCQDYEQSEVNDSLPQNLNIYSYADDNSFWIDTLYANADPSGVVNPIIDVIYDWSCNISYLSWDPCQSFANFVNSFLQPIWSFLYNIFVGWIEKPPFSYIIEIYNYTLTKLDSTQTQEFPDITVTIPQSDGFDTNINIPVFSQDSFTGTTTQAFLNGSRTWVNYLLYFGFGWWLFHFIKGLVKYIK